jgi:prepilin-type N-terminal cleavage/methylation domain-containing protein
MMGVMVGKNASGNLKATYHGSAASLTKIKGLPGNGWLVGIGLHRGNGFSLTELLIALAIMGILAVLAVPSYTKYVVKSRQADAKTQLVAVRQAQEIYRLQYAGYTPDTSLLSGWQGTVGKYAFSIPSCTSSNFTAKASWTDGSTEMDVWTMDDSGTLTHTTNNYQVE